MKVVLVGASDNILKYGNIILRDLLKKGHTVVPVNPNKQVIKGIKCYNSIAEIEDEFDVIDIVTPPEVTIEVLRQAKDLGHMKVWCQPGSADDDVRDFLIKNRFDYVADACIMMEDLN